MLVRKWIEFDMKQIPDDDDCLADLETFNERMQRQSLPTKIIYQEASLKSNVKRNLTIHEDVKKSTNAKFSIRKYLLRIAMIMCTKKRLKEVTLLLNTADNHVHQQGSN